MNGGGATEIVKQRIRNEVEYSLEREVLNKEGRRLREARCWQAAIKCADIIDSKEAVVEVAEKND